jgi:hypothetical protein
MKWKKMLLISLKRARERFRREGFFALLQCAQLVGIQIKPFYYMKEVLPPAIPAGLTDLPQGFEFSTFDFNDVMAISKLYERECYRDPEDVISYFNNGKICLGIKCNSEIRAFTWISFGETGTPFYPVSLAENEAYLFDMYVLKAFRGMNLAPILRYRTYVALKDMGRDTFYSITEFFNSASFRFKQKLDAKAVFLGVYIALFGKWYQSLWVVRRYY